MEVYLSPELETKLARLAGARGADCQSLVAELVFDGIERLTGYDDWFIAEVEKGLAQIAEGKTVSHEAVERRLAAYFAGQNRDTDTPESCA